MTNPSSDLSRIRAEIEATVYGPLQRKARKVKSDLMKFGLTQMESDTWIANEPDFNLPLKRPPHKLPMYDIGLFRRDIAFIQGDDDCIKKPLIGSFFGSYSELRARSTVARLDVKLGGH